jgi:hypothetical protein
MQVIAHHDIPVTNKEARLHDSVVHVAGNWMAQPKAHGIESDLPLKKLHHCTDAEQIIHIIHKAVPESDDPTLEGTLHKLQELAHRTEKGVGKAEHTGPVHHEIDHDRDVVVGFLQSAIGQIGKTKDISHESKTTVTTMLHEACHAVLESSSPLTILLSTEGKLVAQVKKEEEKFRDFLNWFHKTAKGLQRKLT